MATFVCIIVLAYSKRQQSQYWIAYTRLYRLFTTSPYCPRRSTAHVSPTRTLPLLERTPLFFRPNFQYGTSKTMQNIASRGGKVSAKRAFTFNFINTELEGCDKYAGFGGISNVKQTFERCSQISQSVSIIFANFFVFGILS